VEEEPASELASEPKLVLQVGSESLEPQTVGRCTWRLCGCDGNETEVQ
jgi:hypothetical protein